MVLVLKGIVPSENSFALQNDLLANAVEKLTPVTPVCSFNFLH